MRYILLIMLFVSIGYSQDGVIKTYYPDGMPHSESVYANDVLDGAVIIYFPNGNIMTEKYFSNGILNGTIREFFDSGLLKEEYLVKYGKIDGTQRVYYPNGSLKSISVYNYGVLAQSKIFEYDSSHVASPKDYLVGNRQQQDHLINKQQEITCDVDVCPFPVSGFQAIYANLVYPQHALLYGLQGIVTLSAVVDERGDVINTEVIRRLGLGCDEAAQEAVKKTKFIPGQKMNKVVASSITLNVEFKIGDQNNEVTSEVDKSSVNQQNGEQINDSAKVKKPAAAFVSELNQTIEITCNGVDDCPEPEDGKNSIYKNLQIPVIAKRLKLKGQIIIEANIDKFGITNETKIISGIGYGCDESVESALMRTKFRPAKKSGTIVDSKIVVYFPFTYVE